MYVCHHVHVGCLKRSEEVSDLLALELRMAVSSHEMQRTVHRSSTRAARAMTRAHCVSLAFNSTSWSLSPLDAGRAYVGNHTQPFLLLLSLVLESERYWLCEINEHVFYLLEGTLLSPSPSTFPLPTSASRAPELQAASDCVLCLFL